MANYGYTTIEHFADKSFLNTPGLLRSSRFRVEWTKMPKTLQTFVNSITENVQGVTTPGFSIETVNTPLRTGIARRRIETVKVVFYESEDLDLKGLFYKWISMAAEHKSQAENFARMYPAQFMCDLTVKNIKTNGSTGTVEVFTDVFPTGITEMTYDVTQDEQIANITVTFAYRFHSIK